mmetsp:Transcript_26619/g.23509  ORF Transcript_26619/g.23509 Transcript_26619/m.23509 type:complete len:121 (+) Transcript_26619:2-364(+)
MNQDKGEKAPLELKTGRSSLESFLKNEKKENAESLKDRYKVKKGIKSLKIFPTTSDLKFNQEKISEYIDYEQTQGSKTTIKARLKAAYYERVYTKYRGKMVPFWYTKQFKETAFMHFPRI